MVRLVILLLIGCGSVPVAHEPEILTGSYKAIAGVIEKNEGCRLAYDTVTDDLEFNSDGQLKSPFPGIQCEVTYEPLTVDCNGYGANMHASGQILNGYGWGSGTATGNLFGCTDISFWFNLKPK